MTAIARARGLLEATPESTLRQSLAAAQQLLGEVGSELLDAKTAARRLGRDTQDLAGVATMVEALGENLRDVARALTSG